MITTLIKPLKNTSSRIEIYRNVGYRRMVLIVANFIFLIPFWVTVATSQEVSCKAYAQYQPNNDYSPCGGWTVINGVTNFLSCKVGTTDAIASICYEPFSGPETGVKCKTPQQYQWTTHHFYQGTSAPSGAGRCICINLLPTQQSEPVQITIAMFDQTGCGPSPYE